MLRNREFRQLAALCSVIAIVSSAVGFLLHPAAGILSLLASCAYSAVFFVFTKARYKSIAQISEQIDLVLHNADHLYISEMEEGELSILQSEITKMTLRIREQNNALIREKEHLADSLSDIAHQLRTPLTSANLILTLLEKNPSEDERKSLLRETEELFAHMDWLLNSLLKLSRLDAGVVTFQNGPIEVSSLVSAAAGPLMILMELHSISLQAHVPEGVIIQGDPGWLSEAIRNILKNCIEGAGDNGCITVTCEDTSLFTLISLHDSGPGFKKEDLPHLFERFYRGKNTSTAGYGIGLALSKTIITRQGGTVSAKNHPRGGALFCIRFPK